MPSTPMVTAWDELARITEVEFDIFNYFKLSTSREKAFFNGTLEILKPYTSKVAG
jgi:hypothetical protein